VKQYAPASRKFSEQITIPEISDAAHADNVNAAPKQLIENDLYLKEQSEGLGFSVVDGVPCMTYNE